MEQPSLKLLSFDIDNYSYDQAAISESVRSVLERASQSPQPDLEYVYHEGYLYISRFVPDEAMNKDFRCRQEGKPIKVPLEEARSCRLAMDRVGQIDTLHFDQESTNEDPIAPDSVEIQVQCVGLNAKVESVSGLGKLLLIYIRIYTLWLVRLIPKMLPARWNTVALSPKLATESST